jgi:polysaccharide export outer membrane protein
MCPLAGDVQASGLSIFQVRDSIRDGLSRYIVNPQVSVSILSAQSQKIIVLGEVRSPGFFPSDMPMSLVEVVARAGGVTADAEQRNVLLIRGGMENPDVKVLNLEKVLKTGDLTENVVVRGGDIVYMPRSTIADVSKFFGYLSTIISPIVEGERAYLLGDEIRTGERGSVRTR